MKVQKIYIRPQSAPDNWLCNVKKEHFFQKNYDVRGHIFEEEECHCVECLKKSADWVESYTLGEPIEIHPAFPKEELIKRGYVGIYREE